MFILPPAPQDYSLRMSRFEEADNLIVLGLDAFGREVQLEYDAAAVWLEMQRTAEKEGVHLLLLSGFRSVSRQREIIENKLNSGLSLEAILKVNAYPGFSEHHTGKAIDLGSVECEHFTETFEATREFAWLKNCASQYGFIMSYPRQNFHGIVFEPWHWMFKPLCKNK